MVNRILVVGLAPYLLMPWAHSLIIGRPLISGMRGLADDRAFGRTRGRVGMFDFNPFDAAESLAGALRPLEIQSPPSQSPLAPTALATSEKTYALQEKALSISGEDFTVKDSSGRVAFRLNGFQKIPLPGVNLDKVRRTIPGFHHPLNQTFTLVMTLC